MSARPTTLDPKRKREIAARAEELATYYTSGGEVNVEQMVHDEGIEVHYEDYPEAFDGYCGPSPRGFVIVCNSRKARPGSMRSRYTLAHEFGHYSIPDHRQRIVSGEWPVSLCVTEAFQRHPEEVEADWFAANLLLPETAFRTAAESIEGTALDHVRQLSRHFRVSATACAYRLLGLGLLPPPAAVLRWTREGKAAGHRMSDETAALRVSYRKLASPSPRESVTAAAIDVRAKGPHHGRIPAMKWFPNLSGYDRGDNAFLREEVMNLGEHGWLTLLHAESDEMSAD